jgi:hypothetical protein
MGMGGIDILHRSPSPAAMMPEIGNIDALANSCLLGEGCSLLDVLYMNVVDLLDNRVKSNFVRNRMPVSLRGGGGELGNLKS